MDLKRFLDDDCLTILLVRHGEAEGEPIEGLLGRPLTKRGHRQAQRLAERLHGLPLDYLYCSDMARSFQTAEAIRKLQPDVPWKVSTDLRELTSAHFLPLGPNGKPKDSQRVAREQKSLARFARRLRRYHKIGQCVLIVAHGNLIRALVPTMSAQPLSKTVLLHTEHTSVAVLRIQRKPAGRMMLMLTNCTRHLPASMVNA